MQLFPLVKDPPGHSLTQYISYKKGKLESQEIHYKPSLEHEFGQFWH